MFTGVSVSADYIRMSGHDMFFNPNLNIPMGLDTVRDGPNRVFLDPYGVLNPSLSPGEAAYNNTVRLLTTEYGYNNYDALNLSVEKRYSNNFSLRGAYSYSLSRGVAAGQGDTPQLQVGTDLKLDEYEAPSSTSRGAQRQHQRPPGDSQNPRAHLERDDPHDDRRAFHDPGRHAGSRHEPHQLPAAAGRHVQSRRRGPAST